MDTPQEFYEAFNASCTGITTSLASLSQDSSNGKNKPESLETRLAQIAQSLQAERKKLNDATPYLPPHDRQSYDTQLSTLESKLNALRNPVSKGKFAFKKKKPTTNVSPSSTTATNRNHTPNSPPPPSPGSSNPNPSNEPSAPKPSVDSSPTRDPSLHLAPSYTGENLKLITLSSLRHSSPTPTPTPTLSTPKSLTISGYNGCIIYHLPPSLPDEDEDDNNNKEEHKLGVKNESLNLTAVYLQNIQNSAIILGHVNGAVLAHNLERCAVVVSCHQLRIHTSHHTSFHLSVRADAIIEDSTALTFGAYPTSLPLPSTQPTPPLRIHDFTHPSLSPSSTRPTTNWTSLPPTSSTSTSSSISRIISLIASSFISNRDKTHEGIITKVEGEKGGRTDAQNTSSDDEIQLARLLNALMMITPGAGNERDSALGIK